MKNLINNHDYVSPNELRARLEQMESEVAQLWASVGALNAQMALQEDDVSEQIETAPMGDGEGSTSDYRSYFKVVDASTPEKCMVGVTDGGWLGGGMPTYCGIVKINGVRVDVPVFTKELDNGSYFVWLHSWIDASAGEQASIIVPAAGESAPPNNQYGGVGFANQLLGRVYVKNGVITDIVQDYLHGGEHLEWIVGECSGIAL